MTQMIHLRILGGVELTDATGASVDTVAAQSKRFALLVYLTLALPRGWHRRDTLLALFWPDLDQARARHALRQALHFLRKSLGEDVIKTRGSEDVAAGSALWCDAAAFEDGDMSHATLALYRGELLPGFFVREAAPEWDHWVDGRRDALRKRAEILAERPGPPEALTPVATPTPRRTRRWRWPALAAAAAFVVLIVGTWMAPRALARSTLADSLYRRGVATLQSRGDNRAALGWFEAALQASPRFPLAAYYAGVSADPIDEEAAQKWFARAQELLPLATEHDRLLIETAIAFRRDAPEALATAESLATRYPADPLGHHMLAATRLWSGDFAGALREFRTELAMTPRSRDAEDGIVASLQFLDSLPSADRAARAEVQMAPQSAAAWGSLSVIQAAEGHIRDSRVTGRHAAELAPGQVVDPLGAADLEIRNGDFSTADRMLHDAITYGTSSGREQARWLLVISLRNQGRLQEALRYARDYRRANVSPLGLGAVPVAQVLFELGRTDEAGALFDSIATPAGSRRLASGVEARRQSWALTHAAEAWAVRGDTTRVKAYADTIDEMARRSLYGRDSHLPAHLRGLVWLARGNPDSALTSLRSAVFSLSIGYTRTNLELARLLLGAGHAREAATVASAGLAEAVDGSAYYATRTELHELAARAFDVAGQRDSAVTQYLTVVRAWSQADPMFAPRVTAARERLAALNARESRGLD
jgi:tetratricopeptide (TPR) repeat protein